MDKRRIEINVSRTHWEDESIDKLIKELEEAKKKGATGVYIVDGSDVDIYYERPETDAEFEARKLKVKERQEKIKKKELEQLAKLKAKYE